jgi:hypothetical protein
METKQKKKEYDFPPSLINKEYDVREITQICIQFSIFFIWKRTNFGIKTFQQLYHALKLLIIINICINLCILKYISSIHKFIDTFTCPFQSIRLIQYIMYISNSFFSQKDYSIFKAYWCKTAKKRNLSNPCFNRFFKC